MDVSQVDTFVTPSKTPPKVWKGYKVLVKLGLSVAILGGLFIGFRLVQLKVADANRIRGIEQEKIRVAQEADRKQEIFALNQSETDKPISITSGSTIRTFSIHIPADFDRSSPIPVLFAFHGGGDTAAGIASYSGLSKLADTHQFLVVYPDGYKNSWADGRGVAPGDKEGINDVQLVRDIVGYIAGKFPIDNQKMYATGFSAGGYFLYTLACQPDAIFQGIAPVGAGFPSHLSTSCKPGIPVSMVLILGTADPSYSGAYSASGVYIQSGSKTLTKWAGLLECTSPLIEDKGQPISITGYNNCKNGSEVNYVVLKGVGHDWISGEEGYFDTGKLIVSFFGLSR